MRAADRPRDGAPTDATDAEWTRFGVALADEGPHAFDPDVEWWNESWFWDWFDATGERAGHVRIGLHPNQGRAFVWAFLLHGEEWIAVEEPRLDLRHVSVSDAGIAYDRYGLRFAWTPSAPLRAGRLAFEGFGRALSGSRAGRIVPIGVDLEITASGPPHGGGRHQAPGHASERFPASRFEQPIDARGTLRVGTESAPFAGRGERDHSWGPRAWNLEWTFLVLSGEGLRLQCAEARIANVGRFTHGYLQQEAMQSLAQVDFDVTFAPDGERLGVSGSLRVVGADGKPFAATLETISAAEIDLTHCFVPPRLSRYRRALIRGRVAGSGAPLLGWLEWNRFVDPGAAAR